ncbi:hypothetical protein HUJ04_009081 [Dendroctonus ponderosae]|nr:hypothetical protein HUJ04_009081 [Dendroctonus ponderosae]
MQLLVLLHKAYLSGCPPSSAKHLKIEYKYPRLFFGQTIVAKMRLILCLLQFVLLTFVGLSPVDAAVTLTVDGLAATIRNDYVELNFKADATISTVNVQGTNLAASGVKSFYLDWNDSGGPLKQDLTVHQECLVANYFLSGHFGTPGLSASPGWTHIYGPFLLYFPTGDDGSIISAVQNQVASEQSKWPYSFVNDAEYPTSRGKVSGNVSGQKSATVVLWDSTGEEFALQELGYLYSTQTDSTGYYAFDKVRPGNYRIAAYPTAGLGSDSLDESTVTVEAGATQHVGFTLAEPDNILWSLGEANRLSSEFKYSDQPRNYQWEWVPPAENTFTIGSSDPREDWYYAQSQTGSWYIKYQDTADGSARTLRVAIAASSKSHLQVIVNGHRVGDTYFDNDQSIYRSAMQSGRYTSNVYTVSSAQVVSGENTIEFHISIGQVMYDTISMQRS